MLYQTNMNVRFDFGICGSVEPQFFCQKKNAKLCLFRLNINSIFAQILKLCVMKQNVINKIVEILGLIVRVINFLKNDRRKKDEIE